MKVEDPERRLEHSRIHQLGVYGVEVEGGGIEKEKEREREATSTNSLLCSWDVIKSRGDRIADL